MWSMLVLVTLKVKSSSTGSPVMIHAIVGGRGVLVLYQKLSLKPQVAHN